MMNRMVGYHPTEGGGSAFSAPLPGKTPVMDLMDAIDPGANHPIGAHGSGID